MDVLLLSRLQFAVASMFHFLFVPLTLGLSILLAVMEWKYVRTGNEEYKRMVKFWGRLFIVNFAIGVLTGITLEFQFGTNWSRYSEYVGDIFGSLLAIEATLAFFLESTFLAIWIFGWNKVSKKLHAWCITLVAIASNISAYWILTANAWMQNPVGYVIRNSGAELSNFFTVLSQEVAILQFLHTVSGAYILAGFFVMGISAYHLLKKQHIPFFEKSFRIAIGFTLVFSILEIFNGHLSGNSVARRQPGKMAAMEALWESQTYAPVALITIPDEKNERNYIDFIKIPGLLSILAYNDPSANVTGLKDIPRDLRPPVALTFYPFRIMVILGCIFPLLSILGWIWRKKLSEHPKYLHIMLYSIPLPYIALEMGWMLAEIGRQPWIVYGIMKTKDAVSPIAESQVFVSLIAFIVLYSILGVVNFFLLARLARKGPEVISSTSSAGEVA